MLLRILFAVILVATVQPLFSQSYIGQRTTLNYQKNQYNGGTQNWKIRQDEEGRMYFANNEGVLVFDGIYWQIYPLPNKSIVRSIEFGNDKRLYVGGQDEMGYFSPAKNGSLTYTSIKDLLPAAEKNFSDIWDIESYHGEIFFRSHYKIFKYSANKVTVYSSLSSWFFLGTYQDKLIAHDEKNGIYEFKNNNWQPFIAKAKLPDDFYITNITAFGKDSSLVTTSKNGLYILTGNKLKYWPLRGYGIDNHQLFSGAIKLSDKNLLIGTYTNGVFLADHNGNVVENISKKEGLQNSNVRTMFVDANSNIWLGLDNGIDYIAYTNAIKHVNPAIFKDGGGYSVSFYKNSLYFALSNGIYQIPVDSNSDLSHSTANFNTITQGQSWNLTTVNGNLLAGNDNGLYRINGKTAVAINQSYGFWIVKPLTHNADSSLIAAGFYYGVLLFQEKNNIFINKGNIGSYKESARFLEIDSNNNIWTSHPYRGVYKLSPGSSIAKLYTKAKGLPSTLNNFVFKIKNRVVVTTEKGIYEYNSKTDRFEMPADLKKIFGEMNIRYLKEDQYGNIWFVALKNIGIVDYSSGVPSITYFPELNNRILSGFENVFSLNKNNIFVGAENGFYHINYSRYKQNIHPLKIYIRKVKAISNRDSLLFNGYYNSVNSIDQQSSGAVPSLAFIWNSLHFEYSSPVFEGQSNVEYSYLLEGFDKGWSNWSKKSEKDYTNLSAGKYTFKIKARNHQTNQSSVATYVFYITPPWYQTVWAYTVYFILFIVLFYFFFNLQEKRHQKNNERELLLQERKNIVEQQRIAYLHKLELEISEKEVVNLKNENLEKELEYKNSELASAAMILVQKREFLLKVKDELQAINTSGKALVETIEIKKILRLLSEDKKNSEEWEQFSIHFNKVHGDFLNTIKERYHNINQQELKLCAYLIMNLSSKEIAQLMCISVRGVEISRYRVRKKMGLPTETNLFEFLFEIQRGGLNKN
jgi:DNA-binding CsgD family transcriptional regulator